MKFSYGNSLVKTGDVKKEMRRLSSEIRRMKSASKTGYRDDRASINLCVDRKMLREVKKVIREKKRLGVDYLVVVGIGGSNLGTIAVQEAVLGKLYNHHAKTKVLYADTVDSDSINEIIHTIRPVLKRSGNVIINGVSKSGGTTETIANFELLVLELGIRERIFGVGNSEESWRSIQCFFDCWIVSFGFVRS
jgi:glucose-6-phosphate isomerase